MQHVTNILTKKTINTRYMNRYLKLISYHIQSQHTEGDVHHICPRAKDMFPEYADLKLYPWNKVVLPFKVHVLAHILLARAFGGSQIYAAFLMRHKLQETKGNPKYFEDMRQFVAESNKERGRDLAARGIHNSQIEANENRHHWQSKEYAEGRSKAAHALVVAGDHNFQQTATKEKNRARLQSLADKNLHPAQLSAKAGSHQWQSEEHSLRTATHNKTPKMRKATTDRNNKMVADGSHPMFKEKNKEIARQNITGAIARMPILTCPHCPMTGKAHNMKRYHFDNCKVLNKQVSLKTMEETNLDSFSAQTQNSDQ